MQFLYNVEILRVLRSKSSKQYSLLFTQTVTFFPKYQWPEWNGPDFENYILNVLSWQKIFAEICS